MSQPISIFSYRHGWIGLGWGAVRSLVAPPAVALLLLSNAENALAGSATWGAMPSSGDWNTAGNWTPMTIPNSPSDIATFAQSNTPAISLTANTQVSAINFTASA